MRTYCDVALGVAVTASRIAESACSCTEGAATALEAEISLDEFEKVDSSMFR